MTHEKAPQFEELHVMEVQKLREKGLGTGDGGELVAFMNMGLLLPFPPGRGSTQAPRGQPSMNRHRRSGRVRQVGPPLPLKAISSPLSDVHFAARLLETPACHRIALRNRPSPGRRGQDVAGLRGVFLVGDVDELDAAAGQPFEQGDRQETSEDNGEVHVTKLMNDLEIEHRPGRFRKAGGSSTSSTQRAEEFPAGNPQRRRSCGIPGPQASVS